jgi:hypothetical protein
LFITIAFFNIYMSTNQNCVLASKKRHQFNNTLQVMWAILYLKTKYANDK